MRQHLASLVEEFRAHPGEIAVVAHTGVRRYATTYGELATLAGRVAAELARRGIQPGERVVLWGENSAAWIGVFFGCVLQGVLAVPLDAAGSTEFAQRVVAEVGPRLIVADEQLLLRLQTAVPSLPLEEIAAHLPTEPMFAVNPTVREDAAFQIIFTSGTTSEPKGIVHTHRNVLASLRTIEAETAKYRRYERWVHPLRFLHTLPLSHVFGQFMGLWVPALLAAELHFTDSLDPARTIDLIHRERISVLVAVPRVAELLRAHLLRHFPSLGNDVEHATGLSVLKRWWRFRAVHRALGWKFWAVISGGASLPPQLERFWNAMGFALIQGYGMTETAALITLNHPFKIVHGTLGKALPGREVRLSDAGEIMVRGEMVSAATWQGGHMQPREGEWLATGDLGERSASGELRFVGRKGETIVTAAGLNIHPADIESVVMRQPGVRGCVVVPCELAAGIEAVTVVLFDGSDDTLQQIALAANRELAEYQHIRRILRWPELSFPFTSTGKLLRRTVREWACAALQQAGRGAASATDALLGLIAEVTGEHATGSDNLRLSEDLYLDSLGRVQLGSVIEQRMGVELPEDQLAAVETLGELRALLLRSTGAADAAVPSAYSFAADAPQPEVPASTQESSGKHSYPRWSWWWPVQAMRVAFIEAVLRSLVSVLGAPRIAASYREPPPGPLLIIANHVTAVDGALILYALPGRLRRRLAIAMSGEMLQDFRKGRAQGSVLLNLLAPVAYALLTALFNVFPLPRLQGFRRSFAHAGEAMNHGYSVLIFPEGTRSRDGQMLPFRPGTGLLASQARVPVLPVALLGLDEIRSGKLRRFRSGSLEIRIGETVLLPKDAAPAEWTHALESALRRLRG